MTKINFRVTLELDETVGTTQAALTAMREYKEYNMADQYWDLVAAVKLCTEDTMEQLERVSGTTVEISDMYYENGFDLTDYDEVIFI
jgi:hypothetical protein